MGSQGKQKSRKNIANPMAKEFAHVFAKLIMNETSRKEKTKLHTPCLKSWGGSWDLQFFGFATVFEALF